MVARAIWKGVVAFGAHRIPTKLYSAVREKDVRFRLITPRSHEPVEQVLIDPETDEVVSREDVRRAFSVPDGFVVLRDEELEALEPEDSREIAIERFVPAGELGPEWRIRSYHLGPDGSASGCFAFAAALQESGTEGIAHWVMRGREYTGVISARDHHLMLTTLRHAGEVITRDELPTPRGRAYEARERTMAEQLVAAYEDAFDPTVYSDEHRERVLAFIAKKKRTGKTPRLAKVRTKRESSGLTDALQASLAGLAKPAAKKTSGRAAAKVATVKRKPAKKATTKKATAKKSATKSTRRLPRAA